MKNIYKMAGHCSVKAIKSVIDGENLKPILGQIDKEDSFSIQKFSFNDNQLAVRHGNQVIENDAKNSKGAVFISEGQVNFDDKDLDALIVKIKGYGKYNTRCTLALPYSYDDENKINVKRPRLLDYESEDALSREENLEAFLKGIQSDRESSKVLQSFYNDALSLSEISYNLEEKFSSKEWAIIKKIPYVLYVALKSSDENISQSEIELLRKLLLKNKKQPSIVLRTIINESILDIKDIIDSVMLLNTDIEDILIKAKDLISDKLSEKDSLDFRKAVMNLAKQFIRSSSGSFFSFSTRMNDKERYILNTIESVFHL